MRDTTRQELNIPAINERFENAEAAEIVAWVWQVFADQAIATSSFQTQSMPLLHIISEVAPELRVFFLDTGFHFSETLRFRDEVGKKLGLRILDLTSQIGHDGFLSQFGTLYRRDPDRCCYINKVEPLDRALADASIWITGIRRDQTSSRQATPIIERRPDGLLKIAPLANWQHADVDAYIEAHQLPRHPLLAQGYRSVGCQPCTRAVSKDQDYREGRWAESGKKECGLHEDFFKQPQDTPSSEELKK